MSDFAHTRRWWPAFLIEEWMPPGRERPENWLAPDVTGTTTIRWNDSAVAGTLSPGETVRFVWWEERGSVVITVKPDGTWTMDDVRDGGTIDMFTGEPDPMLPAARIEDANWFALPGEPETMTDTMDEFARCHAEAEPLPSDGDRVCVQMGYWCSGVEFVVSGDGKALTTVGGHNG